MQSQWRGHTLEVRGDWTFRWLYLAPDYELLVDGESADTTGGPLVQPRLEAMVEREDGSMHHVEAEILSIVGLRPRCRIDVDGEEHERGHVAVANVLNPFLMLVIIVSTGIMLYLGPDAIRAYWPF